MKDNVKPKIAEILKVKVKSKDGEERDLIVSDFSENKNKEKDLKKYNK
ncbi:MAG: hypothetical protein QXF12_02695 [Candidatus Aenigmatarchaeota archaeon]